MVNCVSILGSTGSIGRQTLDIIDNLQIPVCALTAGSSVERMAEQCRKYRPRLAVMATQEAAAALHSALADLDICVEWGEEGLIHAASMEEADCVITAVVGMVGLKPTLAAIRSGKRIGLANKETLVCAGELVMAEAKKYSTEIIPVDSEHSAIFQCLMGSREKREVKRIILTCSGGPFFGKTKEELAFVTKADALRHPNWKMESKYKICRHHSYADERLLRTGAAEAHHLQNKLQPYQNQASCRMPSSLQKLRPRIAIHPAEAMQY